MNIVPIAPEDVGRMIGSRSRNSNKGDYGYIGLIGGSVEYAGAARLAYMATSAMRSGAGVVRLIVPDAIVQALLPHMLECTLKRLPSESNGCIRFDSGAMREATTGLKSIGIGMGMGQKGDNKEVLEYVLGLGLPTVIDADALNTLARAPAILGKRKNDKIVLTPHPGEFSRLTGLDVASILKDPGKYCAEYAASVGVTVLLKGADTYISDGRRTYLNTRGTPGMATAGSGDVLTGIIAALLARNDDVTLAAAAGAYIAGVAGELAAKKYGDVGMISPDTVACIAEAIVFCGGSSRFSAP